MSAQEAYRRVQAYFKSKFQVANAPTAWIEGCVDCYRQRNPSGSDGLLDFVRQQWLLADFKRLRTRSLPPDLADSPVATLNGNYLLQVPLALFGSRVRKPGSIASVFPASEFCVFLGTTGNGTATAFPGFPV